jgi:hypothetical protein
LVGGDGDAVPLVAMGDEFEQHAGRTLSVPASSPHETGSPSFSAQVRWRTYERKYERWERVVERANEEFAIQVARLLGRT